MNYIDSIERYHEYSNAIHELLGSILTGVANIDVFHDEVKLKNAVCHITRHYPFADLIYTLDKRGIQTSENMACPAKSNKFQNDAVGADRSQRPYFLLAKDHEGIIVTDPYLSSASRNLCISAILRLCDADSNVIGYLVLDIDLNETMEFLMGDSTRKAFVPAFRVVYSFIAFGLFSVVGVLLYSSFSEVISLFSFGFDKHDFYLKPFGVIIYLTLGLAIFDLGKTILEEEVLMHKDIFRHSSTRRTITRFIAAILIAVSIEALLMMFKSAMGDADHMSQAVLMMSTAVGLLIGLGIYVYLGARAEAILLKLNTQKGKK